MSSKSERQKRYRTTGAAANLVKVETLVPADGRAEILALAARLRKRARRAAAPPDPPPDAPPMLSRAQLEWLLGETPLATPPAKSPTP